MKRTIISCQSYREIQRRYR